MDAKRKVEVFSAGCSVCIDAIELVKRLACESCEVEVLEMNDSEVCDWAQRIGARSVPAVVIDGKLAECCAGRGPDEQILQAAGLGQAMS